MGICPKGSSVQGGSFQAGPLSEGVSVLGSLSEGVLGPAGSLSKGWGSPFEGISVRETSSPVDRQTPVKILPCPKLRLREVKLLFCLCIF